MNLIQSYQPNTLEQWDFSAYGSSYSGRQSTQVSASQQQNKDITIFTEEGDKVTISYDQQSQAFYSNCSGFSHQKISGSYDNYAIDGNKYAMFQDEKFEYDNSRYFSMSVDGDLNEQELKDVRKTIRKIDKIMTNLLNGGDISEGVAKALKLVNLDSISGLTANYSYENAISIEQTTVEEVSTYSKEGLAENVTPVINNEFDYIKNLIDEMVKSVRNSGVKPSKTINPIKKVFSHLLKDLSEKKHQNQPKIDLARQIEEKLIEKIKQMPEQSKFPINHSPIEAS